MASLRRSATWFGKPFTYLPHLAIQASCTMAQELCLGELPAEVPAATAHPALDKALDSTVNAPPLRCLPLLLGFAVDQRMSSVKSFSREMKASANDLNELCCAS